MFVSNAGNADGGPSTIETLRTTGAGDFSLTISATSGAEQVSGELLLRVVSAEDGQPLELAIDVPAKVDFGTAVRYLAETKRAFRFRRKADGR